MMTAEQQRVYDEAKELFTPAEMKMLFNPDGTVKQHIDEPDAIIYCYTNLNNGKKYVGQTLDFNRRCYQHKINANNITDPRAIDYAIEHEGIDSFRIEVLETCPSSARVVRERYYINTLKTMYPRGYNLNQNIYQFS